MKLQSLILALTAFASVVVEAQDIGNPFPGEGGGGDMNMTDPIMLNSTDAGGGMQPPPEMGGGDMPGGNGTAAAGGGNATDGMPGDGGNIFNDVGGGDGNETSTEISSNTTMTGSDNTTDAGTDMGTESPTEDEDTGGDTLSIPTGNTTGNDTFVGSALGTVAPRPGSGNATAPAAAPGATCASTADCAEGDFCSSDSVCLTFNCTTWSTGFPLGDVSYSEAPCDAEALLPGSALYDPGDRFCGWDGNCYLYDCEAWYNYGPVAFTGYDPNNPQPLTCEEFANGKDENMNSVVNGCRPYVPGNKAPEAKNWVHFFNWKCTATPRGSDDFQCYQNKPNTNYQDFLAEAARVNLGSCDREIFENEQPLFWYEKVLKQVRGGTETLYKNEREDTVNTPSFDPSEADKTMFAVIISPDTAPQQTFPDSEPTAPPSAASSIMRRVTAVVAGFASLFFL